MKKIVFFVLLSLMIAGTVKASLSVDLQPQNAYVNNNGFYVSVQNNGPDDFSGTFSTSTEDMETGAIIHQNVTADIMAGNSYVFFLFADPLSHSYLVWADCYGDVMETKEDNNIIVYYPGEPRVEVTLPYQGLIASDFYETLEVLPGEYFYTQLSLREMNYLESIIGLNCHINAPDFVDNEDFRISVQNSLDDSNYYYVNQPGPTSAEFEWIANSSSEAINYFWLACFEGTACGLNPGSLSTVVMSVDAALTNFDLYSSVTTRQIKAIDRIRGDVNDDGTVDENDWEIMNVVVNNSLYNPCISFRNMYIERGTNYGAGIVLFSRPDFVSLCLLHIWIHDQNDPLVQGLGIGQLMSEINPCGNQAVQKVENTFSVSGNQLIITAPGANIYNVIAQKPDGSFWQATAQFNGQAIDIPDSAWKYKVETVNFVNMTLTGLPAEVLETKATAYPSPFTDQIKLSGAGQWQVLNMNGQVIFSSMTNSCLVVDTREWPKGVYFAKQIKNSNQATIKLVKN